MIKCKICNKKMNQITYTHLRTHGITHGEYKAKFPDAKLITPESTQKRSEIMKGKNKGNIPWNKGIPRTEKEKDAIRKGQSIEGRKRVSEDKKKAWKEGKYNFMFGSTNPSANPEVGKKIADANRKRIVKNSTKKKMSKARTGKSNGPCKPHVKEILSKRMKKYNPMFDEEVLERHPIFKSGCYHFSKGEKMLSEVLDKLKINYTHQKIVKNINPKNYILDFYLDDFNLAVEFDGHYSHVLNPEKDIARDEYIFQTYGIKTLRILPSELNLHNRKTLIKSILGFIDENKMGKN